MAGTLMSKFNTATEGFSTLQKVGSVAMVAAIAAGVFFYANTTSQSPMAPLYTELTTADAASITEQLRDSGINYDITDRGATVRVPENDIYEARLLIERAGVSPSSQSDGFSTLDGLGITSTQFQQRVAYQRGLASEIENSLEEMASVDEARVNLVIPEQDLFVNDSIQASASVMLNTNSRLTSSQVTAIASLVSGAVEGLTREQVTITDQDGTVLTAPGATNGAPADDLERTRELEANIAGDVLAIVEAVAGPGNARVAVNATVDWSATSEVSEVFSPVLDDNGEQLRSAASTVIESDDPTTAEGILGTGDIDTLGVASTVRADVDADFLVDRSVKTVESNGGEVQTLTASVVVDSAAVDPADMATLITLVEAATGLSVENGNLSVAALAFDTTAEQQITAANEAATEAAGVADAAAAQQATMRTGIIAGFAAIAGLLALLSFRRARKSTTTDGAADKLEALLSGETQVLERTAPTADMTALNPGEQLALVSSEHPDDVAELIGSWMTERTAVTQ